MSHLVLWPARSVYRVGERIQLACRRLEDEADGVAVEYPLDVELSLERHGANGRAVGQALSGLDEEAAIGNITRPAAAAGLHRFVATSGQEKASAEVLVLEEGQFDEHWEGVLTDEFEDNELVASPRELQDLILKDCLGSFAQPFRILGMPVGLHVSYDLRYGRQTLEGRLAVPRDAIVWHCQQVVQAALEDAFFDGKIRAHLDIQWSRVVFSVDTTLEEQRARDIIPLFFGYLQSATERMDNWSISRESLPDGSRWICEYTMRHDPAPPARQRRPVVEQV